MKAILAALAAIFIGTAAQAAEGPVYVGLDAEFGLKNSTSAQSIEKGARIAIDEVNRAGGVLGGRKLELVTTDNRSVQARARDNIEALAAKPDLVAVLCGRFSPVVLDTLDLVHASQTILLDPWASADGITESAHSPNYVFRLSLRDRWAMPTMLAHARGKGATKVGLLLPNTGWGRSNANAAEKAAPGLGIVIAATEWYNWGDRTFLDKYERLLASGAKAVLLVANDLEGAPFVREVAGLPAAKRLPVISHWGVTGGEFAEQAGGALDVIDFSVVQTFNFSRVPAARRARFMDSYERLYGAADPLRLPSPVGIAQAYDLVRLLAQAVDKAGSTDRSAIRTALEQVRNYDGLARKLPEPFTATRHDALSQEDVFMAVYDAERVLRPVPSGGRP